MPIIDIQKLQQEIQRLNQETLKIFEFKNSITKDEAFLKTLKLEYKYFKAQENSSSLKIKNLKSLKSNKILRARVQIELAQKLSFWLKAKLIALDRIGNFKFYKTSQETILYTLDKMYYTLQRKEASQRIKESKATLRYLEQTNPLQNLTDKSLLLFKSHLESKYKNQQQRVQFELSDLKQNAADFLQEYPVILSTTYSIKSSLNLKGYLFDYVIIDEASQVDLITGFLALSSAKNVVIVGDTKQLSNVIAENKLSLKNLHENIIFLYIVIFQSKIY